MGRRPPQAQPGTLALGVDAGPRERRSSKILVTASRRAADTRGPPS